VPLTLQACLHLSRTPKSQSSQRRHNSLLLASIDWEAAAARRRTFLAMACRWLRLVGRSSRNLTRGGSCSCGGKRTQPHGLAVGGGGGRRQLPWQRCGRVSCGFLSLSRSLVGLRHACSLSARFRPHAFFSLVLGPLSFFPTNSLVFSRHPEQRLPCMAPAMRESDAKATFFWMPWS
jgi:hypothetical protein